MQSKETGEFFLIDWKRVNKKHELTPNAQPFANRYGFGECSAIPDTHFHKYSMQCSIYATMLNHSHGIDVGARLYLVRMHVDRRSYQVVHCRDWRSVARSLVQAEHARLMAKLSDAPMLCESQQAVELSGGPRAGCLLYTSDAADE